MSATYDPELKDEVSQVRFLMGDTNTDSPYLQDEEILGLIAMQGSPIGRRHYCVAAQGLEMLMSRWLVQGAGIVEKVVGDLRIRRENNQTADNAVQGRIAALRSQCAGSTRLLFKAL